ncbi:hypothetical protein RIR_jg27999.t1 [Rhizophagus irregularis DAOM 181602=DAOM 197198]|nr:hypothetical protein RIR_jg27999.t1 [Rhizophagus irregularis DAOM 181602=DAOM 197198]
MKISKDLETDLHKCKWDKALINLELLDKIKAVLLDSHTCDKYTYYDWTKKQFCLKQIVPGDFRVMVKANNKPVLMLENMYEVLCRTNTEIDQYARQSSFRNPLKKGRTR